MMRHVDEDTVSLVTMETSALVAPSSGAKKKQDDLDPNGMNEESSKAFSLSQQQMAPSLPIDPESNFDDMMLNDTNRSIFGRKKSSKSLRIQHDIDAALYSSDNNTDVEDVITERQITQKKKKSGFFSRVMGKGSSNVPATVAAEKVTKTKRYQSLDKNYSKKQLRTLAREADVCDKAGIEKYESKSYKEAAIFFAQAYEHKKRVFGEHSVQVACAVEKLAKSEDMLVLNWKEFGSKSKSHTVELDNESTGGVDSTNNQVTYRYNACTHYRDARYIYEMHNVDTLRILTDMGNFFFREGMDDDAIECFDTLTKAPRKYSDQEVVEVSRAYFQMGEIYRSRNQFVDAIVCYENAFYLQKDVYGDVHDANAILLYHTALSHMEIGEKAYKDNENKKANESFVVALDYLKKALNITRMQIEPSEIDDIDMLRLVAQANIRLENVDGALDATSQVIGLLRKEDSYSEDLESLLKQKSDLLRKKGDYENALQCLNESMEMVKASNKSNYSSKNLELYEQMIPLHLGARNYQGAITCLDAMIPIAINQDLPLEAVADLQAQLGRLHMLSGNSQASLKAYLEAKKNYSKRFGSDHPKVGDALHSLGNLYFDIGNWSECESCYDKAMVILNSNPDVKYENMDTMLNNMGYFAYSIGEYDKASNLYKQAISTPETREDKDDGSVRSSTVSIAFHNNYANVLIQQGEFEEAIKLYEEALRAKSALVGNSDIRITGLLYNLGTVYLKVGNTSKALENYEKARAIRTKNLGREHEEVLTVYSQIGNVYCGMGKYTKAHEIFRYVLKMRHEAFGINNEHTLNSMMNQAFVLYKMGHFDLALSLYEEVLESVKYDDDWEYLGAVYHAMGNVYTKKHDYANAIKVYTDSLELKRKVFKYENKAVSRTLHNLGLVYSKVKKYNEAEISFEEAMFISMKVLKPLHPDIGKLMIDLGKVHQKKCDYTKAKQYFSDAKQLFLDAKLPEDHVYVKSVSAFIEEIERITKKPVATSPLSEL